MGGTGESGNGVCLFDGRYGGVGSVLLFNLSLPACCRYVTRILCASVCVRHGFINVRCYVHLLSGISLINSVKVCIEQPQH